MSDSNNVSDSMSDSNNVSDSMSDSNNVSDSMNDSNNMSDSMSESMSECVERRVEGAGGDEWMDRCKDRHNDIH